MKSVEPDYLNILKEFKEIVRNKITTTYRDISLDHDLFLFNISEKTKNNHYFGFIYLFNQSLMV